MKFSFWPAPMQPYDQVLALVADYEAIGVDELIVPDFTLGDQDQKIAILDRFVTEVAGR